MEACVGLGLTLGSLVRWVGVGVGLGVAHAPTLELRGGVCVGTHLGEAATNRGVLEEVNVRTLEALPPGAAVDHHIGLAGLEATLERLHLAHLVVLVDVDLPQVGAELGVILGLGGEAVRGEVPEKRRGEKRRGESVSASK